MAHTSAGEAFAFQAKTLVVAVKANCDGCRPFLTLTSGWLDDWRVVLVAREPYAARDDEAPVLTAPAVLDQLHMTDAAFYVALDGAPLMVVAEGFVFDLQQVRAELPRAMS